jgi:Phytanoyl-CoA dioxygenase (PhyH)
MIKPQEGPAMSNEDHFAELSEKGFCVLRRHFPLPAIEACRKSFWPLLLEYVNGREANRGPHRHFMPMPFQRPCFAPEFFFDTEVLNVLCRAMDERFVADQWGCDTPLRGSQNQNAHVDYQRPLFPEVPDLPLPPYMLVVSFGLIDITPAHGAIEIAPGTHRMPRSEAMSAVESAKIAMQPVLLKTGDVLIRHPSALHRGTPNTTDTPRPLVTIRYVRHWYADNSRDVNAIPQALWRSFTPEQQKLLRFPVEASPGCGP